MLTAVFAGLFTHVRMYTIRFWLHAFQRYRYIDKQKHCVPDIAPRAEGHTVSPIARCPKYITQRWSRLGICSRQLLSRICMYPNRLQYKWST